MSKRLRFYQALSLILLITTICLFTFAVVCAAQKSMKLKIGFNVEPKFLCKIVLNEGETTEQIIFCNTTKNGETTSVSQNATLSGNLLSLNQTFVADLAPTLNFTIYNYSEFKTKVSVANTTNNVILAKYESGTPISQTLTVSDATGEISLLFEQVFNYYNITYTDVVDVNNTTTASDREDLVLRFEGYYDQTMYYHFYTNSIKAITIDGNVFTNYMATYSKSENDRDYTYYFLDLTIPAEYIVGDISINVKYTSEPYFK